MDTLFLTKKSQLQDGQDKEINDDGLTEFCIQEAANRFVYPSRNYTSKIQTIQLKMGYRKD